YLGELPQQMEPNLAALDRLQSQLRLNADNQPRAMERRASLVGQLAEADALAPVGGPEGTAVRLARLRQELIELRTRFSDKYPDVARMQADIAALERKRAEPGADDDKNLDSVSATTPYALRVKQAMKEVEAEIEVLTGEGERLRGDTGADRRGGEKRPRREQEYWEPSRDSRPTRELSQSLSKRHEEAQIAESMEQGKKGEQFRVLDPAVAPRQPVASPLRLMFMTLALSVGLAVGAVVVAEHLDTSFHAVDDLRRFSSVPVLVSIPRIIAEVDVVGRRFRFRLVAIGATVGLVVLVGFSVFVLPGNEQLLSLLSRGSS